MLFSVVSWSANNSCFLLKEIRREHVTSEHLVSLAYLGLALMLHDQEAVCDPSPTLSVQLPLPGISHVFSRFSFTYDVRQQRPLCGSEHGAESVYDHGGL